MNEPIMMTPHDIWNVIMAVCGAIITVSAAIAIIVKLLDKAKEPNEIQNKRISELETEVAGIQDRLRQGDKNFEEDIIRINKLELSMKKSNQIIIEGLQVLIEHGIDGNNTDGMKDMKKKLDKYLLEK